MSNAATDLAKSNAAYAQSTGSGLLDQFGMTEEEKQQQADQLGQQAQAYYQNLITSGGYTPEQAERDLHRTERHRAMFQAWTRSRH